MVVLAFAGASFGFRDIGAKGVKRVVCDEAVPDEVPESVDGLAGVAVPGGVVEVGEEAGSGAAEVVEDSLLTGREGFRGGDARCV